jgi:hypothetical protein
MMEQQPMSLWQLEADTFDTEDFDEETVDSFEEEEEVVIVETKEEEIVVQAQEPVPVKRLIPEVRASRRRQSAPSRGSKAAGRIRP